MAETGTKPKQYKLKEVCVRLEEGHSLYSAVPLSSPQAALDVMRKEMSQYDREVVCVVNLNTRNRPINFHVVSIGDISSSIAAIPNIMKSGILSNATAFMMLHNHPSGELMPSDADITVTKKVIEAGKLLGIPCVDHIIVGGGNDRYLSMREENLADFSGPNVTMTAEEILRVGENEHTVYGKKGEQKMADEKTMPEETGSRQEYQKRDEISLKFGAGLAEPFTAKDGRELVKILIPNKEPGDKSPWASFVLPAKAVHENKFGKGLWAKIPADGTTTVTKPELTGQDENGKNIWTDVKREVPNKELKGMVEAYKTRSPQEKQSQPRESAKAKLDAMVKDTADKLARDPKPKRPKAKSGQEL